MRWEESEARFGTLKLYSSKTKKWRTLKAPAAATLIAQRKTDGHGGTAKVLTHTPIIGFAKFYNKLPRVLAYAMARRCRADGALTICATLA
jgi:hypothetical protein